jgi:CRP/FNR family transcriptional regulator, cyclic AMP receptor protein
MASAAFFHYPGEAASPPAAGDEITLLPDLDETGWNALIAHTEARRYARGETVIAAGARDRSLYIVADGSLTVAGPGGGATLEQGAVYGEIAFFDGLPHDATVRARTESDLLVLSEEAFAVLAARDPALARAVLFDLGRILALRLRRALT